ncbi:MAG: ABC transporter substrate-binding protein [Pseudomonadota bacterium]
MLKTLAAMACGAALALTATAPAMAQKAVRVGLLQPMSGGYATYGRETQAAVEFLVKTINDGGGIKSMGGAKLELILADTASQSGQATREAVRLITQENVDVILGALLTNDMLAVTQAIEDNRMPTISFFAGGTKTKYAYSVGFAYDDGYASSLADFVKFLKDTTKIPVQKIALAYANYEGGQQINKYLKQRFEKMGFEIVAEVALDVKGQDFMPALLKIKAADPDAVVGLMLNTQIIRLQQSRYQLKYYKPIFVSTLAQSDARLKRDLGDDVGNAVLPEGVFGMALYSPSAKLPSVQKLADLLLNEGKLGDHFGQLTIPAAQAVRVLQRALEIAGTTDREKLTDAIGKVTFPADSHELYFPLPEGLAFGDDRLIRNLRSMFAQWSEGPDTQPVVVYPQSVAAGKPHQ